MTERYRVPNKQHLADVVARWQRSRPVRLGQVTIDGDPAAMANLVGLLRPSDRTEASPNQCERRLISVVTGQVDLAATLADGTPVDAEFNIVIP